MRVRGHSYGEAVIGLPGVPTQAEGRCPARAWFDCVDEDFGFLMALSAALALERAVAWRGSKVCDQRNDGGNFRRDSKSERMRAITKLTAGEQGLSWVACPNYWCETTPATSQIYEQQHLTAEPI